MAACPHANMYDNVIVGMATFNLFEPDEIFALSIFLAYSSTVVIDKAYPFENPANILGLSSQ